MQLILQARTLRDGTLYLKDAALCGTWAVQEEL